MSIARKTALGFVAQMYMMAVGLLMTIVVARQLGPEGKGIIAIIAAATSFTVGLASMGLAGSVGYFAGKRRFNRTDIFWSMVGWSLFLGTIAALTIWIFRAPLQGSILKGLGTIELLALLLSLPSTYFSAFVTQAFLGYGRVVMLSVVQSLTSTLNLAAVLVSTLLLHSGTTGVVVALTASTVVGSVINVVAFGRVGRCRIAGFREVTAEAIPYGLKAYVGGVTQMFSLRADVFFLNLFAGPAAVGVYSVATNLAEKIWLLCNPVNAAVYSQIAGEEKGESARIAGLTGRANSAIGIGAALLMLGISIPLIPVIYGQQFSLATLYLAVLLPGTVAIAVSGAFYAYYVVQLGRPGLASALAVISAIISAVLYVALIPAFGALGAAIGSTVSYSVALAAYAFLFPRETGIPMRDMFVPKQSDIVLYQSIFRRFGARLVRRPGR